MCIHGTDVRRLLRSAARIGLISLLAGCSTAPPHVWLRTDGQSVRGNPALAQQAEIDRTVCRGETSRAGLSGTVIATGGLAGIAAAQERTAAQVDVFEGCMAAKGYVYVPADQADAVAERLAATARQRAAAAPAGR